MMDPLLIAKSSPEDSFLLPQLANRHGLIAGATGTGKTITLQKLAESFSEIGVPVFVADIKGDLSGIQAEGTVSDKLVAHLERIGVQNYVPHGNPVEFWDVFGEQGHPLRTTISDMGALLLARLLNLNATQSSVLQLVFRIADEQGLLLLDIKDLRSMIQFVGDHASTFRAQYGNISIASVGAIQRGLINLETNGGNHFFGEPMLNIDDLIQTNAQGKGIINVLAASQLILSPQIYSTFLLWLMSELFEQLPEVGDQDKPKLVFFFDEAHLLFKDAPKVLTDKIEQVVRLIRSKGVGIYFVTQNPSDIPDAILGQLGNRIQHALRAYTPRDLKAVKVAASTMRQNPALETERIITELGTGEALVSFLDPKGTPSMVQRASVIAPCSRMGPLTEEEKKRSIRLSDIGAYYAKTVDRESAYEILEKKISSASAEGPKSAPEKSQASSGNTKKASTSNPVGELLFGSTGPRGGKHDGMVQVAAKSMLRSASSSIGRSLIRGLLGSLGGKR